MSKILVVEDDVQLSEMICRWLTKENFIVESVANGAEGLSRSRHYSYDLLILDWNLPEVEGIEILKSMRAAGNNTPVLMLTGLGAIENRVEGLDSGADDYLTKPFHARELIARVTALLRRPAAFVYKCLKIGAIEINTANNQATLDGVEVKLQPREFELLKFFMNNPNQLHSMERMLAAVWPNDSDATSEAVTTCIKRLRKRFDVADSPSIIKNVHGVGYGLFEDDLKRPG